MKLKLLNEILVINIVCVLMILAITFIPWTVIDVIIGLPFLLFFPGYILLSALFINTSKMNGIEKFAASIGMSIAIVAAIGFGLNYTSWGIRLLPVLYSTYGFIFLMSAISLYRRGRALKTNKFTNKISLRFPGWSGNAFNKSLSIILIMATIGTLGILGYTVLEPKIGEQFTEFYILGLDGKAEDYPTEYILNNGQITQVTYSDGTVNVTNGFGAVMLGIVNQEQQTMIYTVKMTINGVPVSIKFGGDLTNMLGPIELQQGERWENEIGIIPNQIGENQKVELLLYDGTGATVEDSLHFWINVK